MISNEIIEANKQEFISLISLLQREGLDIDKLIEQLTASDFFVAPASTKYHGCYKGGLVDHCLSVYYNLDALVKMKGLQQLIPQESIIIAALFHDMAKMDFYESYYQNKKIYCPEGNKRDDEGSYKWASVQAYKVKDPEHRMLYGSHEQTSEYIARQLIPLTYEESVAILNHHGGLGFDSSKVPPQDIYEQHPLAALLHMADNLAVCIDKV